MIARDQPYITCYLLGLNDEYAPNGSQGLMMDPVPSTCRVSGLVFQK